ncbi:MAG TPA: xanthine dehydrogenase family protein subunit M [Aliiroseovarius sp.]|nr:xanthine dehydrogenase family protein subunit M [Aliiroseovarius sp.]
MPDSLPDALAAVAGGARVVAGGTDFFPALGEGLPQGDLVDLTRVAQLRGIARLDNGWRIGAATPWAEIARADLPSGFDALRQAARQVGAVQIQNAGTIGGNLVNASPAADGVPPLLLLDAEVELASQRGARRLALADFLTGPRQTALAPGELLVAVHLPEPPEARSVFLKLGSRAHLVISFVMVAALIERDGSRIRRARVAVGACSPVAQRLRELESGLIYRPLSTLAEPGLVTPEHLAPLSPIDDIRADGIWRLEAAHRLVADALCQAGGQDG